MGRGGQRLCEGADLIHTYMYICIHTIYICIHTHIYIYTYIYLHIHTYIHVHIYVYIYVYSRLPCTYSDCTGADPGWIGRARTKHACANSKHVVALRSLLSLICYVFLGKKPNFDRALLHQRSSQFSGPNLRFRSVQDAHLRKGNGNVEDTPSDL